MKTLFSIVFLSFVSSWCLAGEYIVSNSNDAGPGSFRQAVIDANAAAGADTIRFKV